MDQGVHVDVTPSLVSIDISPYILIAIVILAIAFTFRRRSLSERGKWDKAWDPISPSLKESPPPMVTSWRALNSLLSSWWTNWVWVLLLALALDLALFQGAASIYVWNHLGTWSLSIGQGLKSILVKFAGFILGQR